MSTIDLYNLGLSKLHAEEAATYSHNQYLARVSVQHKDIYTVITEKGELQAKISGKLLYVQEYPVVGDWVLVDRSDDTKGDAIINHILTRKSCLERKAAGTGNQKQLIAANIDTVFICMSLNNDYNLRRMERYLSIVWDSRATPVIVLTKSDLCTDLTTKLAEINSVAMGVDVAVTSCFDGGYSEILKYVNTGITTAFVGSSGVGKSTLINRLVGEDILATKDIRHDDKGRHTTTHRQLIVLPKGGVVIDTPGMRELQIAGADLSKSFADIDELAQDCYFRDCKHESEPNCAVKKAIQKGLLSAKRFENYQKMQREMVYEDRKSTMSAAKVEQQKIIDRMGSLNGFKQAKKISRKNPKR